MLDFSKFSFPRNKEYLDSPPIYYESNHVGYYFSDHPDFQVSQMYLFWQGDWSNYLLRALEKEFNVSLKLYKIYIPAEDFLSRLSSNQLGCLLLHQDNSLRSAVAYYVTCKASNDHY